MDQALARFPSRCVKSGEPAFGSMHNLKLVKTVPNEGSVTVEIAVPLTPEWVERAQSSMAGIMVGIGGLMIFGGIGLALWNPLFLIGMFVGVLVLVAGLIGMVMQSGRVLQLKHIAGGKVWLTGASPQFLADLPSWNPLATEVPSDPRFDSPSVVENETYEKSREQPATSRSFTPGASDASRAQPEPIRSRLVANPVKVQTAGMFQQWALYGLGFAISLAGTVITMAQVLSLRPGQTVRLWAPIAFAYNLLGPPGAIAVPALICIFCLVMMVVRLVATKDK